MSHCEGCSGACAGCGRTLDLTEPEIQLLSYLAQIPFLAVARRADDMTPHCECVSPQGDAALAFLERKNLVSIDYDKPLKGYDYSIFSGLPVHGSAALTQRGQQVIELLETQGVS